MGVHPNHVTTFSNINLATVSVVQYVTVVASTHMVKYFVAMIRYLARDLLVGGLIGPTKSIACLSNACSITYGCKGISSLMDGFPTL
jgi:hypothetical protein